MGSLNFAMTSSLLGIMCFGGLLVKKGELTGGELAFHGIHDVAWVGRCIACQHSQQKLSRLSQHRGTCFVFLAGCGSNTDARQRAAIHAVPSRTDTKILRGDIVFDGVTFSYSSTGANDEARSAGRLEALGTQMVQSSTLH